MQITTRIILVDLNHPPHGVEDAADVLVVLHQHEGPGISEGCFLVAVVVVTVINEERIHHYMDLAVPVQVHGSVRTALPPPLLLLLFPQHWWRCACR